MKKIYLTMILGILLIAIVGAGIGISSFTGERQIEKEYRDEILNNSKTNANDISPEIKISCDEDYCLWGAFQEGVIDSSGNKIKRRYCSEEREVLEEITLEDEPVNYTYEECLEYSFYSLLEVEDMVADELLDRLEAYAIASISRRNINIEEQSEGEIEIKEKRGVA